MYDLSCNDFAKSFKQTLGLFVLETIRTGTMRVIHITVKTEETQRLRIKFVLPEQHLSTVCTVLSYLPVLTNTSKSTFPTDN